MQSKLVIPFEGSLMNAIIQPKPSTRPNFVTMAADALTDVKELAAAHTEQIRNEIKTETTKAISTVVMLVIGGFLGMVGLVFVLVALVSVLQSSLSISPSASWGIVALGCLIIGGGMAFWALRQIQNLKLMPRDSLKSIGESLTWITKR